MSINSIVIDDIFNDVSAFFAEVDKVFTEKNKGIPLRDIVCDCTGGPKLASLGMALACLDRRRLIYFPRIDANDASEYMEIDTKNLWESIKYPK